MDLPDYLIKLSQLLYGLKLRRRARFKDQMKRMEKENTTNGTFLKLAKTESAWALGRN
jgi:hypothetical protein